jgi:protein SCO1/2
MPDRASPSMATEVLDVGATVPDAALIDENDKRRAFAEWHGTPTLVTFIYTRCPLPNFCPLMDRNFAAIQRDGANDPTLAGKFKLVSVSFDPEHDTPAVLRAHARELGADAAVWTFLTADKVTIDRFAAKFGVGVVRDGDAPGVITHNLRTTLIGADGKILKIYGGSDWTPATALADLRAAVTASGK